ncbi:MscL family protein [Mycoplasma sp. Ms02]|uniref:MscL family protein n=1 Tax=Mycoplasma sp. Ms02 TaxID=353851 RepID=UPI001C89F964|nr:MscL family protein [Mycoplasma sp. Ms02]QZE12548.1 MscL family protein [Mycoplasma sp. Ms02]
MFKKSVKSANNFLKKGNMLLLAIGLLLGTVFNAVVASLANDIIMSAIANAMGSQELEKWAVYGMKIGKFLGTVLNFVIVTFLLFVLLVGYFMIVHYRESKKPVVEAAPAAPSTDQLILAELKELNQSLKSKK